MLERVARALGGTFRQIIPGAFGARKREEEESVLCVLRRALVTLEAPRVLQTMPRLLNLVLDFLPGTPHPFDIRPSRSGNMVRSKPSQNEWF